MDIPTEYLQHILAHSRQLISARFSMEGQFIEGNEGFCEYFKGLLQDGACWNSLFMAELPQNVDESEYLEFREANILCSRMGGAISSRILFEKSSFFYIGEVMDVGDKQLIEEIADISNEMSGLMSQLRKERRQLKAANAKIQELSRRDPLTGIYNRRAFMEMASQKCSFCRRYDFTLSMLYMDLDHFKSVNDTWGHDTGDVLLKAFTDAVTSTVREEDIFARLGGEEFVLLLPSQNEQGALNVAERVLELCRDVQISGIERYNTVSIGVAEYSPEMTLEELIASSDTACYYSKENGRDRVTAASLLSR